MVGVSVGEGAERQAGSTVYSIGQVSSEEQLYVELLNRTRANPSADLQLALKNADVLAALNFFAPTLSIATKTNALVAAFAVIPPAPPLAINAKLTQAARVHVQDMKTQVGQEHLGSDGSTPATRASRAGYFGAVGENIYVSSKYTLYGHYAFDVDWGSTPSGIQEPPGHRNIMHDPAYKEVGVAVDTGSGTVAGDIIGPQLVAQELGFQHDAQAFLTGVVYYDVNGNNFYDPGEGIGNATITASGAPLSAISASSGGYSLPLANGNYSVTIAIPGGESKTSNVTIANETNVKLDFRPAYTPPAVTTATLEAGATTEVEFSAVAGAIGYDVRRFQLEAAAVEGAENGATTAELDVVSGYQAVVAGAGFNGSAAFRLATVIQNGFLPPEQTVTLKGEYQVEANSSLEFRSKLGFATEEQIARVDVSADSGQTWTTVYQQAGASPSGKPIVPGESSFNLRTASLAGFEGKRIKVRFHWDVDFRLGFVVVASTAGSGWFFDEIKLNNASLVAGETVTRVNGPSIDISVPGEISMGFQVRAITSDVPLPYGPLRIVPAVFAPTEVQITGITHGTGKQFAIDFELMAGKVPATYSVELRPNLGLGWNVDSTAVITPLGNNRFRAAVVGGRAAVQGYYRIRANP